MKLIKEIGKRKYTENSRNAVKFGMYECPSCLTPFEVSMASVKSGNTTKCYDCGHKKRNGMSGHSIYNSWRHLINRTSNHNNNAYASYGGRGIIVCEEWKNSFDAFYNWSLANGYVKGLSIDRINNDGNYEPSNCRWPNDTIQNTNQRLRRDNKSGYAGIRFEDITNKWLAYIRVNRKAIRIGLFKNKESAVEARNCYIIVNKLTHKLQEFKAEV